MRQWLLLGLVLITALISLVGKKETTQRPVIGILQTASHPALDIALKGFLENIGDDFDLRIQNAEGQIPQAHLIAQSFHQDPKVCAVYTIATPATQAMIHAERRKPVVFSAVTDASVLGIPTSQNNVRGIQDMIDVQDQAKLVRRVVPKGTRAALLYNPSEANSTLLAGLQKGALEAEGFRVMEVGAYTEADVATVTRDAARVADVIVTPTDNLVATTIQMIVRVARDYQTPVVVSDQLLMKYGPTAACGVDYEESGRQAAALLRQAILDQ